MADGPKYSKPREFYGESQPANTYPVEHTGSAGTPQRTAEATANKQFELALDSAGSPASRPPAGAWVMTSAPPAQPEDAAEAADYKKRFGDLMNTVGDIRREHAKEMEQMKLMLQLNSETGRFNQVAAAQIPLPPGIDPNKELKVKDLYAALPQLYTSLQEGTRAQVLRESWDVTPEEEAAIVQEYPQVASYARESDRLAFIKRAAQIRRKFAVPDATSAPRATTAPERAVPNAVPQPEAAHSAPVADAPAESGLELATRAYNASKAQLGRATSDQEKKQILRDMRDARDAIVRMQGVTEEMEQQTPIRMKG